VKSTFVDGEEGEKLPWFHQMGPLKCSKPMHTILKHIFLHVQMLVRNIVMLMEVEKDPKPFSKISKKLKHGLKLCAPLIMFHNHLLCINNGRNKFIGGFFRHLVKEKTITKKGKTKMHAKLQCQVGR
jgi:hypothetical protein